MHCFWLFCTVLNICESTSGDKQIIYRLCCCGLCKWHLLCLATLKSGFSLILIVFVINWRNCQIGWCMVSTIFIYILYCLPATSSQSPGFPCWQSPINDFLDPNLALILPNLASTLTLTLKLSFHFQKRGKLIAICTVYWHVRICAFLSCVSHSNQSLRSVITHYRPAKAYRRYTTNHMIAGRRYAMFYLSAEVFVVMWCSWRAS